MKDLNQKTSLATFQLAMIESWQAVDGETKTRKNRITVEVVGKDCNRVMAEAKLGSRATIEGYIRSELWKGQHIIKVRTLTIYIWEDTE